MFLAVLFAVAITITISRQSYTTRWFQQSAVTDFLGEWSMSIYVIHLPIRNLLYKFCETPYELYRLKYIYGALVIAVSLALLFFARYIKRTAPKIAAGVRSSFVNEGVNP